MKVGFLTVDWSSTVTDSEGAPALGGSGHIRIAQYLPYLTIDHVIGPPVFHSKLGIFGCQKLHYMARDSQGMLDPHASVSEDDVDFDCDVVYTQRNMHINSDVQIARARAAGQVVINDVDDWYWGLDRQNRAFSATDPRNNPVYNTDGYRKALRLSSAVVVSTPFLREKIREWNPRTYLLSNHVEVDKFNKWDHGHGDPPTVGWVGATGFRSGDLRVIKPFAKMFRWVHGGHANWMPSFGSLTGLDYSEYTRIPMASAEVYPSLFKFDVGVVPLTMVDFNLAKSNIKGLEYASSGIPFVASKSPEYESLRVTHGIGRTVRGRSDWISALKKLTGDPIMRRDEADRNLELVQQFDVKIGALKLQKFLEAAGRI